MFLKDFMYHIGQSKIAVYFISLVVEVFIMKKPVYCFAEQINGLVSI